MLRPFREHFFVIKKKEKKTNLYNADDRSVIYNPRISKMHLSFYIATNACTYMCKKIRKKTKEDIGGTITL